MSGRVACFVGAALGLLAGCAPGTYGELVVNVGPAFVDLDDGAEIRHTVTVHNQSAQTRRVVAVRTSSSCAKAELSTKTFAPRGSASMTITYVPARVWGTDTVFADLLFDDGSLQRCTLNVSWYPRVFVQPTELRVGGVRSGLTGAATLRCKAYGPSKERVYRFVSAESDSGLTCTLARETGKYMSPVVYESAQELRVTVPPSTKLGQRRATLRLTFRNGDGQTVRRSVTVRWEVTPVVQATPALAILKIGGELSVALQAHDGVPFEILGLSLEPPQAQAWLAVQIDRQNRRVLLRDRSQSDSSPSPMPRRCLLLIRINHPNQEVVQVPVLR